MCFWNWAFFGGFYLECIYGLRSVQRSGNARQASNLGRVSLAFQRQRRALKLADFVAGAGAGSAHFAGSSPASFRVMVMDPICRF